MGYLVDKKINIKCVTTDPFIWSQDFLYLFNHTKINENFKTVDIKVDFVYLICNYLLESGIYRDKTMVDKLMYLPNDDTPLLYYYNLWLKRLITQQNEPTNQNSIKVPKVVKPTNKKML